MASKICGKRCGAAKQAMIIPCLVSGDFKSFLVVLDKIIEDIPKRWKLSPPQALPGSLTISISLGWKESAVGGQQGKDDLLAKFKALINLGAVIAVAAGNAADINDGDDYEGYISSRYPALLAGTTLPSLIRVGAVDLTGAPAPFSQEADVYTVGVDSPCANNSNNLWEIESDGTSGGEHLSNRALLFSCPRQCCSAFRLTSSSHLRFAATAAFIGEVDYRMSLPGNPFGFGHDISQYQQKVKDFYTVGYNRRDGSAHPQGAYRRPGRYANVVWNGQDGRSSTACPLLLHPGAIKKRDDTDALAESVLEPADICANYSALASASATSRTSTAHAVTITPSSNLTTPSSSSSSPPSPPPSLACTQVFYSPYDGPNAFLCQCNDSTWNHLNNAYYSPDVYSECPSQVATLSLTEATPSATVPPDVSCTQVVLEPTPTNYAPLCECSNDMLFLEDCPVSVSAATTTLTRSEPPASVTAALTVGDYVTPSPVSVGYVAPSPSLMATTTTTTTTCVPQCTKHAMLNGPHDAFRPATCYCDPACGGNAHPKPNADNVCPNQVTAVI